MSDLLSIGASGVRAYQSALTTVSENIANVGTVGYARRAVVLKEIAPVGLRDVGGGALVGGVARSGDAYKSAAVRLAGADLAKTQTAATWMGAIQTALAGNGLSDRLSTFFNAARAVAADPSAPTPRAVMLEAAAATAAGFAGTAAALDQVAADIDATGTDAAARLGSLGAALAKVNAGMSRAAPDSPAAASLADRRDQILEEMSALVDVEASIDPVGRASVRVGGAGGPTLVSGNESGSVSYARNEEGVIAFAVTRGDESFALIPNGGALAGLADGAQRAADARGAIEALAGGFASGVNAVQTDGRDLAGTAGTAMFTVGARATDLTVAISDPTRIAASAMTGGTRDNSNIVRLETLRASGGFETKTTALIAGNAAALSSRERVADAQSAVLNGALATRDAAQGVDLDNEAVELLRFQQAYQASSRVIQVAKDIFQTLIAIN